MIASAKFATISQQLRSQNGLKDFRQIRSPPVNHTGNRLVVKATSPMDLSSGFQTRPYTVRKGDTLASIAKKRNLTQEQVMALNPKVNLQTKAHIFPGETILLPAGNLSSRDREILAGIGSGSTRIYPVREGETIEAIATNRKIPMDKIKELNPTVNLDKLKGGEKLLLPGGYYTIREKEMLSTVMPESSLATPGTQSSSAFAPIAITAVILVIGIPVFLKALKKKSDEA